MPLFVPLLLLGAAAGVGGLSYKNYRDAKKIEEEIERIKAYIENEDEKTREEVKEGLSLLMQAFQGVKPVFEDLYHNHIRRLIEEFSKIKEIETQIQRTFQLKALNLSEFKKTIEESITIFKNISNASNKLTPNQAKLLNNYAVVGILSAVGTASFAGVSSILQDKSREDEDKAQDIILVGIAAIVGAAASLTIGTYLKKKELEKNLELLKQEAAKAEAVFEKRRALLGIYNTIMEYVEQYGKFLTKLIEIAKLEIDSVIRVREKHGYDPKTYPREPLERLAGTRMFLDICEKALSLNPMKVEQVQDELVLSGDFEKGLGELDYELQNLKPVLAGKMELSPPSS